MADAALMASARSDVPALVAEVRRLQEENAMLQRVWLMHETIQPDGELAATLTDVVRENERLRDVLEQIAHAGQWSVYHGRDLAVWMATMAKMALESERVLLDRENAFPDRCPACGRFLSKEQDICNDKCKYIAARKQMRQDQIDAGFAGRVE